MKLYATVTSERASKGQGGNKYLEIAVQVEHNDGKRAQLCSIEVKKDGNDYVASCLYDFIRTEIARTGIIEPEDSAETILMKYKGTKGKQQKGESCKDCEVQGWCDAHARQAGE